MLNKRIQKGISKAYKIQVILTYDKGVTSAELKEWSSYEIDNLYQEILQNINLKLHMQE